LIHQSISTSIYFHSRGTLLLLLHTLLLLLQKRFNISLDLKRRSLGGVPLVGKSVVVDQKFGKIPSDIRGSIAGWEGILQEAKYFTRFGAIDMSLFEPSEFIATVELVYEIKDLFRGSWFLSSKLIAWESKNLETTPSQVIHKLGEFGIILFGQTSLASHIGNKENMPFEVGHGYFHPLHILVNEFVKVRLGDGRFFAKDGFGSSVLDCFADGLQHFE
jgi:hypothetical protein